MTNELLPCPFCGSRCVTLLNGGPGNYFVRCDDCLAASNDVQRDHAVELWNRRPAPRCEVLSGDAKHYLSAIRKKLEQLYDASADNPRLREQLSDEVDWVDAQLESPAPAQASLNTRLGIGLLWTVHSALDEALGDTDVTHIEDDAELRERYPVQWAAQRLAEAISLLEDTSPVPSATRATPNAERCLTCDRTDAEYENGTRSCNDPWHGDNHLRRSPKLPSTDL